MDAKTFLTFFEKYQSKGWKSSEKF